MEDQVAVLREELSQAVRKAAELKVRLDRLEGRVRGVPHYSVIEEAAHELGQEVSRTAQALYLKEVVADGPSSALCPKCQTRVTLRSRTRRVLSGDGRVELADLVGDCPRCRRAFFPSAGGIGF